MRIAVREVITFCAAPNRFQEMFDVVRCAVWRLMGEIGFYVGGKNNKH